MRMKARQHPPGVDGHKKHVRTCPQQEEDVNASCIETMPIQLDKQSDNYAAREEKAEEADVWENSFINMLKENHGQPLNIEGDADAWAVHFRSALCLALTHFKVDFLCLQWRSLKTCVRPIP